LRDRLFRLGYLAVRSGPDFVDDALKQAVTKLQREAGLTVDGWVGQQTWGALQELFAFEPSTLLERWIDARGMTPALQRAAALRLGTFGLTPGQTTATAAGPPLPALERWRRVLVLLDAPGISGDTPLDALPLYRYLFDLDRLSGLVAGRADSLQSRLQASPAGADAELLLDFLKNLLKIELWLRGYDKVRPDGKPLPITRTENIRVGAHGKRIRSGYRYSVFYEVIRNLWGDLDEDFEHGSEAEIVLRSYRLLAEDAALTAEAQDDRRQRALGIIDQIDREDVQRRVMEEWKPESLIGLLWDGLKRVWRFLKRLVVGVARRAKLLARAAFQLASESFAIVRKAGRVFSDGFGLLLNPEVAGSNESIAMHRRADFDFEVFVATNAQPEQVTTFLSGLERRVTSLRAALKILELLFNAAITAAALTGPWGWWPLVRSLIAGGRLFDDEDVKTIGAAFLYA